MKTCMSCLIGPKRGHRMYEHDCNEYYMLVCKHVEMNSNNV